MISPGCYFHLTACKMEDIPAGAVIQSFEVLSDRISNLEDAVSVLRTGVAELLERNIRKEMSCHGRLDHDILGIPCRVVRLPQHHQLHSPETCPRTKGAAEPWVKAVVLSFSHDKLSEDDIRNRLVPNVNGPDSRFQDWEQEKIAALATVPYRMRGTGIRSAHPDPDCTHMQRVLDGLRRGPDYPELSKCSEFYMRMPYDDLAFVLVCQEPQPLVKLIRETMKLARNICGDVVRYWGEVLLTVSDCDVDVAQFLIASARYCFSGNDQEVAEARQIMERSLRDVKSRLKEHPFFDSATWYCENRLWDHDRA
jgi:hypothetical protein